LIRWHRVIATAIGLLLLASAVAAYALIRAAHFLASPLDEPRHADAAILLGGDAGDRVSRALELQRAGLVSTFLVTGLEEIADPARTAIMDWRTQLLANAGVPASSIIRDSTSTNSREEAQLVRRLAKEHGWKRILVVSDPPHMRRLSFLWDREFAGSGVEVRYVPTRPRWWEPDRWWKSRRTAQFVIPEYIKLFYAVWLEQP
jgi:uncharacterized SAM-binding protein YcdF (DUF218 family)